MVQVSNPSKLRPRSEALASEIKGKASVKLEVDDFVDEEFRTIHKRPRASTPFDQDLRNRWSTDAESVSLQSDLYNPLQELSPLGLRLRKSPSLLDLIQMKLSQTTDVASCAGGDDRGRRKGVKVAAAAGAADKLKASNFPASLLRIGTWECLSRYEGDLVAKCYFAKHKLVWEVLDGSLKSKIEIQWSDITALKASCPENGPGTLDLVLARQPLFFRETNPQPRKHTLWQATSDFTGRQASIHRRHFLQCAPGLLSKHFEKLIQCDPRLNALSQQPEIVLDSPCFEPRCSIFEDEEDAGCHGFDHIKGGYGPNFPGFGDASSACSAPSSSSKSDVRDSIGRAETPSPISGTNTSVVEEATEFQVEKLRDPSGWENLKIPGLHPSMSMTDLVNHIGNCFSGKSPTGDQLLPGSSPMNKNMLEEIAQCLLGDSQMSSASDENSLMMRVNSLCCLLQNPMSIQSLQTNYAELKGDNCTDSKHLEPARETKPVLELAIVEENRDERGHMPAISRKESVEELLLHIPRIASLPFLLNKLDRY